MAFVGDSPDISGGGPFQANTRIVAIIALTVAGIFVFLGLALSVLRVLQQRAIDRQTAIAALLRSVQEHPADGSGAAGVERTNSSKVPWLVVGPDGIELAIAHKVRVGCPSTDHNTANLPPAATNGEAATLAMATSSAGLLANMHQNLVAQPSNGDVTSDGIPAVHSGIDRRFVLDLTSPQALQQSQQLLHASIAASRMPATAQGGGYRRGSTTPGILQPLYTVMVETDGS